MVTELNGLDRSTITHCWDSTNLSQAWVGEVQDEAMEKFSEIFPNVVLANRLQVADPEPTEEDPDAGWEGQPFMDAEEEGEWEQWVDWGAGLVE